MVWFSELEAEAKEAVLSTVILLAEFGPLLKRPYADTLKGSRYKNLKELRCRNVSHVLRVAYIFDERRRAVLLVGGDKKRKNEKDFYRRLIADAERLYEKYSKE